MTAVSPPFNSVPSFMLIILKAKRFNIKTTYTPSSTKSKIKWKKLANRLPLDPQNGGYKIRLSRQSTSSTRHSSKYIRQTSHKTIDIKLTWRRAISKRLRRGLPNRKEENIWDMKGSTSSHGSLWKKVKPCKPSIYD